MDDALRRVSGASASRWRALRATERRVFTSLFNVTGQPGISIPVHHDDATGLPVDVQVVAAPWREDLLLQMARTLELAFPWTDRRPSIFDAVDESRGSPRSAVDRGAA
jgi:amidase